MSLGSRILKNATYLTLGDKVGYLIQFIFFLYFARIFGVVPTGEYSFGFSFSYAFIVLADLGISVYLVREVARTHSSDRQLFFDCLVLRSILLTAVFILASGTLYLLFNDISAQKLKVIVFWGLYWVFYSLADVVCAEMNGHERMGQVALLGICLKVVSTVAGVILIYLGLDYDKVLVVLPISSLLYLCACVLVSVYYLGPITAKFRGVRYYKRLTVMLFPFWASVILVEILYCQDILILGFLQDDQSVGIYSSAIKIISFILGISPFFHTAMLPVLSKLFIQSKEQLIAISQKILRYLILSSLPISFGLSLTSSKVIGLLYSDLFQEAGIVLTITAWTIALGLSQAIFSVILTAIDRQKEKVIFIGINFIISTLLNIVFIYYYSYLGAAVVKPITTAIGLGFFIYLVSRYLALFSILRPLTKPAIACLLMSLFIHYFNHWHLIYLIPVSGSVYLASLLLIRGFTQEEMLFFKNLLPKLLYSR